MPCNTQASAKKGGKLTTAQTVSHVDHDSADSVNVLTKKQCRAVSKLTNVNEDCVENAQISESRSHPSEETPNVPLSCSPNVNIQVGRSRPKPVHTAAKFQEDDNEIEFKVERDDLDDQFPSEGEVTDPDPESDIDVRSSQSVDEGKSPINDTLSKRFGPTVTIINTSTFDNLYSPICTNDNVLHKIVTGRNSIDDGPTDTNNDNEVVLSQNLKDNSKFEQMEHEF